LTESQILLTSVPVATAIGVAPERVTVTISEQSETRRQQAELVRAVDYQIKIYNTDDEDAEDIIYNKLNIEAVSSEIEEYIGVSEVSLEQMDILRFGSNWPTEGPTWLSHISITDAQNDRIRIAFISIAAGILFLVLTFICWKCRGRKKQSLKVLGRSLSLIKDPIYKSNSQLDLSITYKSKSQFDRSRMTEKPSVQKPSGGDRYRLETYKFNDFIMMDLIGAGASSQVFLMQGRNDELFYAIKIWSNPRQEIQFWNEARLLSKISNQCPFIINVYGVILKPNGIILSYQKEGNLEEALLEDRRKQEEDPSFKSEYPFMIRLNFIHNTCKALFHMHKMNIAHRDLAMRNLLLADDKKSVLLCDFSLARDVESLSGTTKTVTRGVPYTSAPETWQSENVREFSVQSDIWSLGLTMWEIINKEPIVCKGELSMFEVLPAALVKTKNCLGAKFKREDELWGLLTKCWSEKPVARPRIWVVEQDIKGFLDNPGERVNDLYEVCTTIRKAPFLSKRSWKGAQPQFSGSKTSSNAYINQSSTGYNRQSTNLENSAGDSAKFIWERTTEALSRIDRTEFKRDATRWSWRVGLTSGETDQILEDDRDNGTLRSLDSLNDRDAFVEGSDYNIQGEKPILPREVELTRSKQSLIIKEVYEYQEEGTIEQAGATEYEGEDDDREVGETVSNHEDSTATNSTPRGPEFLSQQRQTRYSLEALKV